MCKWIENSGYNVNSNSSAWGNYKDSQSPTNVDGYVKKQIAGYSQEWKVKNIYDLAGNIWEWSNELHLLFPVRRGAGYDINRSRYAASSRNNDSIDFAYYNIGFRIAIYVK